MNIKKLYQYVAIALIASLLLLTGPAVYAQGTAEDAGYESEAPQFFHGLNDIPLMPGLEELADRSVLFEKPEGRIGESEAVAESVSVESVTEFYEKTMPQLGWTKQTKNYFVRDNESLSIIVDQKDEFDMVRITIRPLE